MRFAASSPEQANQVLAEAQRRDEPDTPAEVALEAVDQQRLDLWLQREVDSGRPLSGLLPPDAETLERYRTETGQA